MSRNKKDGAGILGNASVVNIITIVVVAVFSITIVVLLAKNLFASNSRDVPAGIYTGTIPKPVSATLPPETKPAGATVTTSVTTAETTEAVSEPEEMYVIKYIQLLEEPFEGSKKLICMSPNVRLKILERRADGYYKGTFHNCDGLDYTGYILREFLSPEPVDRNAPAAEVQPAQEAAQPQEQPAQ